jgi:arylformamidase
VQLNEPPDPRLVWESLSPADRDAAYDNNAAVADSAALIARRNRLSATLRSTRRAILDVPYADRERTKFDLYPGATADAPCLVFIHGGYWQRNSREAFAMLAEGLGAHGWSVAIPGYTLAPQARLTEICDEIFRALDWLALNGAEHGFSGPMVLCGWSAGAQLAAVALGHPLVVAGLAVSGVYDLAPIRDTGLNKALQLSDHEVETLSPLRRPIVAKPLVVAYGAAELPALAHDARNFHNARGKVGAPGGLLTIPGADHFTILEELRRPEGALTFAARQLVRNHIASEPLDTGAF